MSPFSHCDLIGIANFLIQPSLTQHHEKRWLLYMSQSSSPCAPTSKQSSVQDSSAFRLFDGCLAAFAVALSCSVSPWVLCRSLICLPVCRLLRCLLFDPLAGLSFVLPLATRFLNFSLREQFAIRRFGPCGCQSASQSASQAASHCSQLASHHSH